MRECWIQTHTGRRFYLDDPRPEDVDPVDLAVSLARLCRFNGHCDRYYSVAQHSVYVAEICPTYKLPALLHDAHEAYTGDLVRPLKKMLWDRWHTLETRINQAIAERFNFSASLFSSPAVKHADDLLLATEIRDLMIGPLEGWSDKLPTPAEGLSIDPWDEQRAMGAWMNMLERLTGRTAA